MNVQFSSIGFKVNHHNREVQKEYLAILNKEIGPHRRKYDDDYVLELQTGKSGELDEFKLTNQTAGRVYHIQPKKGWSGTMQLMNTSTVLKNDLGLEFEDFCKEALDRLKHFDKKVQKERKAFDEYIKKICGE